MDTENQNARDELARELRRLLPNLYNLGAVRQSALVPLFQVESRRDPPTALQQLLIKAVEALEPGADCPVGSKAWRVYQVLHGRYIDQFSQEEVARDLFLSPRQLRRLELSAVEELAGYLWDTYRLHERYESIEKVSALPGDSAQAAITGPSGQEEELAWLERTLTSQVIDCADLVEAALQTAHPLIENLKTCIQVENEPDLPGVTVQETAVRQALLHLITLAANQAGAGKMRITTEALPNRLFVRLSIGVYDPAYPGQAEAQPASLPDGLGMAEKLIRLSKGTFEAHLGTQKSIPFQVVIHLPTADQIPVLVVDDNVDTLKLIERYLSGTRYRFFGVSQPFEALPTAERIRPSMIILDVMLPDVDGWDMLGRLRAHPSTQDTPIIICTILPQAQLALMLGAADFVRKPIRRDQLLSSLDRLSGMVSPKSG